VFGRRAAMAAVRATGFGAAAHRGHLCQFWRWCCLAYARRRARRINRVRQPTALDHRTYGSLVPRHLRHRRCGERGQKTSSIEGVRGRHQHPRLGSGFLPPPSAGKMARWRELPERYGLARWRTSAPLLDDADAGTGAARPAITSSVTFARTSSETGLWARRCTRFGCFSV